MVFNSKIKKNLAAVLASFMLLGNAGSLWNTDLLHSITIAAEDETSIGKIVDKSKTMIGPDMERTIYEIKGSAGNQRVYKLEADPSNEFFKIVTGISNEKVNGHESTTEMANRLTEEGQNVVAAVNGDFYDVPTGIPIGMMIKSGEIVATSSNWPAIGFTLDSNTVIGTPEFDMSFSLADKAEESFKIKHINKRRSTDDLILYNSRYGTDTKTNPYGTEVVLRIESGEAKIGSPMKAVVEEVLNDSGSTPLSENRIVLSGHGVTREKLNELKAGDTVDISFSVNSPWENVTEAIGGKDILLKDGQVQENLENVKNPRTAIGTKADGSLMVIAVDGRQSGFSEGVTLKELALLMKEMGAVNALNLDGGGSTTFATREAGDSGISIQNRPSDGTERKNANSLIIVSTAPKGELSKLIISPYSLKILAGSEYNFSVAGVDEHYNPVELSDTVFWATEKGIGEITDTGKFKASSDAASGKIKAVSLNASGEIPVEVVSSIDSISISPSAFSVSPQGKMQLKAEAYVNGKKVVADSGSFEWSVEGDIGTVDENGLFTAKNKTGLNGKIVASYNGVKTEAKVSVGKLPIIVESFESGIDNWKKSGVEYNTIDLALSSREIGEPVKSGSSSLKISYDFKGKAGTSGVYAGVKNYIEIPDYPEKVGMWVYGDGNKHWLRAQFRDGKNEPFAVDFTSSNQGVDWKGWKYVEAKIPEGKQAPIKLDLAARYMETSVNKKDSGVIYIDDITASYGTAEVVEELPVPVEKPVFEDLKEGDWSKPHVMALYNLKIVNGYIGSDGKSYFYPKKEITRQEFAKMIVESQNIEIVSSSSFKFADDAKIQEWAKPYIYSAYEAGVILGSVGKDGKLYFNPTQNINRADMATMIGRSLDKESSMEIDFTDKTTIPLYAVPYVALCVERNIINGYSEDGSFKPLNKATREEAAKMIDMSMK